MSTGEAPVHPAEPVGAAAGVTAEELRLATRNHGQPLEALRYPLTPIGLHYLLIHYDIPVVDADRWRLSVDGAVERGLSLSLDELRAMDAHEVTVTMECAGNGRALLEPRAHSQPWLLEAVGTARWRGVRLRDVLERAGVAVGAVEVVFTGLDRGVEGGVEQRYQRALALDEALGPDVLLAYEMNGVPLPPQHGHPLRLVVPGWYGMTNVKWLAQITVSERPFGGYQHEVAYRLRADEDDPGTPVTRMAVRSLMAPPGIPEFLSRDRVLGRRQTVLEGRAWSGCGAITEVEVSTDGGSSWRPAELQEPQSRWSWTGWRLPWTPGRTGRHRLGCRATDATGARQPVEPPWNVGGYANNAVQWVTVDVVEPSPTG